ncbi:hypothetical protein GCM10011487_11380 [Steroidobacter agaridevorans]|uniref:Uncharacterized protein n=1 Tax=Steroidobacter agaridevorans TaxID=2695856 RepID=A0A829Y8E2_9GAMM|nr:MULTISPECIES: hypothetical protein [Steroidobacteraceae]GFE79138.1 hypothetical protein GCM10011487_11380 [Steroidobacter agaridevorans]
MAEKEKYEALPAGRALEELIEAERVNLMQVQAMARCLYDTLLYSDDDDGAMHAAVAELIARLVKEAVDSLEKIVRRFKADDFGPPPDKTSGGANSRSSA